MTSSSPVSQRKSLACMIFKVLLDHLQPYPKEDLRSYRPISHIPVPAKNSPRNLQAKGSRWLGQANAGLLRANYTSMLLYNEGKQDPGLHPWGHWPSHSGLVRPYPAVSSSGSQNSTAMQGAWRVPEGMMRTCPVRKDRRGLIFSPWRREGSHFSSIQVPRKADLEQRLDC